MFTVQISNVVNNTIHPLLCLIESCLYLIFLLITTNCFTVAFSRLVTLSYIIFINANRTSCNFTFFFLFFVCMWIISKSGKFGNVALLFIQIFNNICKDLSKFTCNNSILKWDTSCYNIIKLSKELIMYIYKTKLR